MTQVTNRRTHSNCATTQNGVADHQIWRRNAHSTECAVSALRARFRRTVGHHASRKVMPEGWPSAGMVEQ